MERVFVSDWLPYVELLSWKLNKGLPTQIHEFRQWWASEQMRFIWLQVVSLSQVTVPEQAKFYQYSRQYPPFPGQEVEFFVRDGLNYYIFIAKIRSDVDVTSYIHLL